VTSRVSRPLAALLAAALASGAGASVARADGDPASDYLLQQTIYLPYDANMPSRQARELAAAVRSANGQGFPIRVALIWSADDLGSVAALWKKPRVYARFLAIELTYVFDGRLLVVMPAGIGFYWQGHSPARDYEALAPVPVRPTPAGLAAAATAAVQRLAAAAGVTVSTAARGVAAPGRARSTRPDYRVVIALAVAGALALAASVLVLEGRASRT
jgi:hypothetical protein